MIHSGGNVGAGGAGGAPLRHYTVDWLRVLAVLGLIPLHAGFAVDAAMPAGEAIGSISTLGPINDLAHLLVRMLLFTLAGMAAWHSLGARSDVQYLGERVRRLVLPLIFVMIVLAPLVLYLDLRRQGLVSGGLAAYLPHYYASFFADLPARTLHMWFALYLFIFALITLPLFRLLRDTAGRALIAPALPLLTRPGLLTAIVLPTALLAAALQSDGTTPTRLLVGDLMSTLGYMAVMLYGYLLAATPAFQAVLVHHWSRYLAQGIMAWLLIVPLQWNGAWPTSEAVLSWAGALALVAAGTWMLLLGLLGFGLAHLNRPGRVLRYLSPATIVVYVLHVPVITLVTFLIMPLGLSGTASYLAIIGASLAAILVLYEALIRRLPPLRLLCGMPSHPPRPAPLPRTPALRRDEARQNRQGLV